MESSFDRLLKFLMRRPLLVNLILIFITVSAIVSVSRMQRVALPRIDMYNVSVYTTYPGASPEDVELNVTRKIETELEGIGDIETYTSMSLENLSIVDITIDRRTEDKDEVVDNIKNAIDNITDFPNEISERPTIWEEKSDEWPILYIGVYTDDPQDTDYIELANRLKDALLPLSTVADITVNGKTDPEIKILLNKDKLKQYQISIDEVINAIQSNRIRLSAGSLESFTSETNIVTLAEFEDPEDILDIIVRINDAGNDITVRDLARLETGYKKENTITRVNGKPGSELEIVKKGNADIIDSVTEINREIERFKTTYAIGENIHIVPIRDESIETRDRLNILYSNAGMGLVLVLILLFFFFNRKLALWTSLGIPIAVGIAFIAVSFFDVTINRVSLLGLVVVLGMLVDDSIIVAENIYRFKMKGLSNEEAALSGVRTVMVPVFATIITTVIAFLPMYFIQGIAMDFAREIPTFVIAMLAGSLIESVLILPVHLGHTKKRKKEEKEQPPLGEGLLCSMENGYEKLLQTVLKHKYVSFAAILAGFAVLLALSGMMVRFRMFPIDQSTRLYIWGETELSSSLDFTSGAVKPIETILDGLPDNVVKSYNTTIGRMGMYSAQTLPNLFRIEISLTSSTKRDMTAMDVQRHVMDEMKAQSVPHIVKMDYYIDGGGPPAGKPVEVNIIGNDNDKRRELLKTVSEDLELMGMTDVDTNYRAGKPEIRLTPDNRMLSRSGLSISQIASVIRTAIDGYEVTHFNTADEEIPFRLKLDERFIRQDAPLDGLYTINQAGIVIPVKQLLNVKMSTTPQTIYRYNGTRTNMITANLPEEITAEEIYGTLTEKYADFEKKHPGFTIQLGGEAEENTETMNKMLVAIGLAVLAVYFVLIIQFNSIIQPVMVISAIPFGLIGILFAFGIQRMDLSMLALTGIMGYSGVVVNDSLIMVDYINSVRSDAEHSTTGFIQNVINGAKLRFRPIFLTTITTVAGLIPTAYGIFGGLDSFISPMVMAMAWGLIVGTPSVLLVIPLYYSIIEDIR
ncbi:MAG: efflux RND transporter permease subunit, partial [Spirochaetota bacterium]